MKNHILMKQVISLWVLGIIISTTLIVLIFFYSNQLKRFGINSSFLETFSIDRNIFRSFKKNKISFLYLNKNKEEIKIKKISSIIKEEALQKMKNKSVLLKSVFHPKPSPYFAILTKEIICPKEFLPVHRKKEGVWMSWTMFANKRYGFGVCNKGDIFFINYKFLKYCPQQQNFFEIDYFIPIDSKIKQTIELQNFFLKLENLIFCTET